MTSSPFHGARRAPQAWARLLRGPALALSVLSLLSMVLAQRSGAPWLHLYACVPLSFAVAALAAGRSDPVGTRYEVGDHRLTAILPSGRRRTFRLVGVADPSVRGRDLWVQIDGGAPEPLLVGLLDPHAARQALLDHLRTPPR